LHFPRLRELSPLRAIKSQVYKDQKERAESVMQLRRKGKTKTRKISIENY